jgi:hypothetical protein
MMLFNMKKNHGINKSQHQIRMDDVLKTRIEKYQAQIDKTMGGLEVSFSGAARLLIEKGLDAVGIK